MQESGNPGSPLAWGCQFQQKKSLIKKPSGILLITPESLEALFMRQGRQISRLFKNLSAVVIDEQHVFLEAERGRQLSSLLNRLDKAVSGRIRRLGLSATIGDKVIAQNWLSGCAGNSAIIESKESQEIQLVLNSFIDTAPQEEDDKPEKGHGIFSVAEHIYDKLSGKTNLVFCNRKEDVENIADYLRHLSDKNKRPNEFLVHHGSLSKEIRDFTEEQLQSSRACTAICSSTLELGIDVGDVDSVAQVGPPHGVSSLKQRLGRSGRRGNSPSRIHICIPMAKLDEGAFLPDKLYPQLIQSIAVVSLMLEKWLEPPRLRNDDFSTIIQQVLSIIMQHGGATASALFDDLCTTGSFQGIAQGEFIHILKDLGAADLIEQTANGDLILGLLGEKICNHYDFYAAFESPDSYHVSSGSQKIGTIDGTAGFYMPGQYLLLAGMRWEIIAVDEERMIIDVKHATGKQPVKWFGGVCNIHPRIRQKMYDILSSNSTPSWLEDDSRMVLKWARESFRRMDLMDVPFVHQGNNLHVFTWTGSRANHTLEMLLLDAGLSFTDVFNYGIGLSISQKGFNIDALKQILQCFVDCPRDGSQLIETIFGEDVPPIGKFSRFLSPELRARNYASEMLDIPESIKVAARILDIIKIV